MTAGALAFPPQLALGWGRRPSAAEGTFTFSLPPLETRSA
jgi:hypothetical protein